MGPRPPSYACHSCLSFTPTQTRVLLKEPKGREVDDKDVFSYNDEFSEKLFRIKINSIQMKETEEENVKTNDQVRCKRSSPSDRGSRD